MVGVGSTESLIVLLPQVPSMITAIIIRCENDEHDIDLQEGQPEKSMGATRCDAPKNKNFVDSLLPLSAVFRLAVTVKLKRKRRRVALRSLGLESSVFCSPQ